MVSWNLSERGRLRLRRLSYLPTVWTNVFTGIVLASTPNASPNTATIVFAVLTMTLVYVVGLQLNETNNTDVDRYAGSTSLYNAWEKDNFFSPFIVGACRALIYITCALLVSNTLSMPVVIAATLLFLYVIGSN